MRSGPKWFKEVGRGNSRILDADRRKSFLNGVSERYADLKVVEQRVTNPLACVQLCGFEPTDASSKNDLIAETRYNLSPFKTGPKLKCGKEG